MKILSNQFKPTNALFMPLLKSPCQWHGWEVYGVQKSKNMDTAHVAPLQVQQFDLGSMQVARPVVTLYWFLQGPI